MSVEIMRVLDFTPEPGPARILLPAEIVETDLDEIASSQQDDGG